MIMYKIHYKYFLVVIFVTYIKIESKLLRSDEFIIDIPNLSLIIYLFVYISRECFLKKEKGKGLFFYFKFFH